MFVDKFIHKPRLNDPLHYKPEFRCGLALNVAGATPQRSLRK